jgi:hypothetical protein
MNWESHALSEDNWKTGDERVLMELEYGYGFDNDFAMTSAVVAIVRFVVASMDIGDSSLLLAVVKMIGGLEGLLLLCLKDEPASWRPSLQRI